MKTRANWGISALVGAVLLAAAGTEAATSYTWTLTDEFSGGTTPAGTITAKIEDAGANTVKLTLQANLVGGEFVDEWDFNLTPDAFVSAITVTHQSGDVPAQINKGLNAFQADGDGKYDLQFVFDNAPPANRFQGNDQAVFLITATGLTADAFNTLSQPAGGHGPFLTAAHVQGIGPSGALSGWVTVPEPSTYVAGTLLLIPLLVQLRRWKRAA